MKYLSCVFCLVFVSYFCRAQDPYLNIQDYQRSVKLSFHTLKLDSIVTGAAGKDVFWDFSDLKEEGSPTSSQIISPDSLADAEFPNTNYIEKYSNGSFKAYSREGGRTYLMGYYDPNSKIKIEYTLPMLINRLPLSYGDVISRGYNVTFSQRDKTFKSQGKVTLESDGYGILRLPHKIYYDVLRVKLTEEQEDAIERFDTVNKVKVTTYYWYNRKRDSPLLKLTESESGNRKRAVLQSLIEESSNLHLK